jgi:hypothetical protein
LKNEAIKWLAPFKPLPRFNETPQGKRCIEQGMALQAERHTWAALESYERELPEISRTVETLAARVIFDSRVDSELAAARIGLREIEDGISRIREEKRTFQKRQTELAVFTKRAEHEYRAQIDGPLKEQLTIALLPYVEALARAAELAINVSRVQEERRRHGLFDGGKFALYSGLSFGWGSHQTGLTRFLFRLRHEFGIELEETGWREEETMCAPVAELADQAEQFNGMAYGAEMQNVQATLPAQRQAATIRQTATGLLSLVQTAVNRFLS